MGRIGSAIVATAYVGLSVLLLRLAAQDREAQGEFDERSSDPYAPLLYLQLFASFAVGLGIETRWVFALPLLVLAGGWTFALPVAQGHAAADVLIRTTFMAVGDLVAVGLGRVARRWRRRSR